MSRVVVAIAALAIVAVPALVATPAYAADAAVVLTPSTSTVESNTPVTYTLNLTCNGPGACDNTVVSFPTNTVTGNGANNNIASWFGASSCPEVTRSVVGNEVRYSYGNLPTGIKQCTFPVTAPEYTTLNGAQATITPTVSGSTFVSSTGAPAVLDLTASHNASVTSTGPAFVLPGAEFTYNVNFICGAANQYDGDIGLSALHIEIPLPATFTFSSYSTRSTVPAGVTITAPAAGSTGGTLILDDPSGLQCANPPLNNGNYQQIRVVGSIAGPVGAQACIAASTAFTYIDGVTGSPTSNSTCVTSVNLQTVVSKGMTTNTWGGTPAYTYPGNWDQGGNSVTYSVAGRTNPAASNAGVSYHFQDALPCLTNLSGGIYQSNALGTLCQNPAFIPTRIVASGFVPVAANAIILHMADGTTQNVPFAAGGWTMPAPSTGGGVAEIEIPPFSSEEANTNTIVFTISGYASANAVPGNSLRNSSYTTPYSGGGAVGSPVLSTAQNLLIKDPLLGTGQPGSTVLYPQVFSTAPAVGSCVATTGFQHPSSQVQRVNLEITKAPSEAIYFDYLAPAGATITGSLLRTFQLVGHTNGQSFSSGAVTPTVTPNYNGTGRTLYQWVVPQGTITVPGSYRVAVPSFSVNLGAGCAGTFLNDMTLGYGAAAWDCYNSSPARHQAPPMVGTNNVLTTNASPIANNYCGFSSNFMIEANNPQYTVNKTVQGNLDPSPAAGGALGHVSPTGGQATYNVTFTNNGTSSNLTDPIMYDILPRVGDTRASSLTPRNSAFNVTLLSVGTIPANTTVSYSTAANPCRPEVLATNPGCTNDWSTTPPTPLSATTALRIAYTGTIGVAGSPFPTSFSVPYTVSTPNSTSGSIAYNSVGTNVIAGIEWFGAAESTLVGLQAAENQPQITKSASVTEYDAVGDIITYTFTVTNNTTVTLSNVSVTDVITDAAPGATAPAATCVSRTLPAATCSGPTTTLAAGQSATFTATYSVRQADIDYGSISDNATSHGTPPTGGALSGTSNTVTVDAAQEPEISLVKTANPTTVDSVGDVVTYSFLVINEGNTTVTGLVIDETDFSGAGSLSSITCPTTTLAPTASTTCTATYSVAQADLTAGVIDNSAVAMATAAGSTYYSNVSDATVDVDQTPSISLVKSASPSEEASYNAGQVITYSFVVTNTGNIPVSGVDITEIAFTGTGMISAISCPDTDLGPTEQTICTASYTLTQEDVDAEILQNTAEATADSGAGPVTSNESSAATPQVADARLTLTKTANTGFVNAVGDVVDYTFAVRNDGNVTVHDIAIDEVEFTGAGATPVVTCPVASLLPGGIANCTGSYTVDQGDIDAGGFGNTATATGLDPADGEVTSEESEWSITANRAPGVSLVKTGDVESYGETGQVITYSFLVTNTGNVTLEDIGIDESTFTGSGTLSAIDCPLGPVAPEASVTCTATYEIEQGDLDRGSVVNTATAFGTPSGDAEPVDSEPSTSDIPALIEPALSLVKSVTPTTVDGEGDTVDYSFLVTNTGNVTLTGIAISELAFTGTGGAPAVTCPTGPVAPGADVTCAATYAITQADVDAGVVDNTAIATANDGDVESEESSASVAITRTASLSLVKSADAPDSEVLFAGDVITYNFVVTNTGNVTITDPTVTETEFSGTGTLPDPTCDATTSLAPGDQFTCQTVYTVTQEDVDAGALSNTATATGTAPEGTTALTPPTDTVTLPSPATPGLELVKDTDTASLTSVGQIVTYTFTVTNTGNTTVTGLEISEDEFSGAGELPVAECPSTSILPGQTLVCTAVYVTVADDLKGETLSNTATATGASAAGETVVSADSSVTIADVADLRPPLAVTGATVLWAGGSIAVGLLIAGGVLFLLVSRRSRDRSTA